MEKRTDVEYDINQIVEKIRNDFDLKRAEELFPELKNYETRELEIMLLEIRKRDWSLISDMMILKHDYIDFLLKSRLKK